MASKLPLSDLGEACQAVTKGVERPWDACCPPARRGWLEGRVDFREAGDGGGEVSVVDSTLPASRGMPCPVATLTLPLELKMLAKLPTVLLATLTKLPVPAMTLESLGVVVAWALRKSSKV